MNMPGFSAEASIFPTRQSYRELGTFDPRAGGLTQVVPSWPACKGDGLKCYNNCIRDCRLIRGPTVKPGACGCGAECGCVPEDTIPPAGPTGPDTANCKLCEAYQDAWVWTCSHWLPTFVCDWMKPSCPVCD
jgi:hypothetical protein